MDFISPSVITSRAAQNHLDDIKARHADLLKGIEAQNERVAQFNANRDAANASQQAAWEKSQNEKIALQQKQQEINLKSVT